MLDLVHDNKGLVFGLALIAMVLILGYFIAK